MAAMAVKEDTLEARMAFVRHGLAELVDVTNMDNINAKIEAEELVDDRGVKYHLVTGFKLGPSTSADWVVLGVRPDSKYPDLYALQLLRKDDKKEFTWCYVGAIGCPNPDLNKQSYQIYGPLRGRLSNLADYRALRHSSEYGFWCSLKKRLAEYARADN